MSPSARAANSAVFTGLLPYFRPISHLPSLSFLPGICHHLQDPSLCMNKFNVCATFSSCEIMYYCKCSLINQSDAPSAHAADAMWGVESWRYRCLLLDLAHSQLPNPTTPHPTPLHTSHRLVIYKESLCFFLPKVCVCVKKYKENADH